MTKLDYLRFYLDCYNTMGGTNKSEILYLI